MSFPSPGPETLLGAKILIRDNYDNTLYTGLSGKKILKRVREGGPDPEAIRLDGDWTTEDPAQGRTESQRVENAGKEHEAESPSVERSVKVWCVAEDHQG